jgi:hypothetical protein
MSKLMLISGAMIDHFIRGFHDNIITLDIPNKLFFQRIFLPLIIAIAVMIYQGWQLSRVKHTYLDHDFLKVSIDNQIIGKLNIKEIKAILLLNYPDSEILILTSKEAITIPKLQAEEDSQLYLYYLQQGIEYFQQ